jgi:hypothetical protein
VIAPQPSDQSSDGVVGSRQLLAVQTFDVARLTTHVVPVVPNTFIAVSGVGPDGDSNGSGKTSFLSAVSILLADPQWRLEVNGGKFASGILFKPDAAGASKAQQIPAAAYGYVVGVFAEPDDVTGTALTVWVRIATTAPYVQARWTGGLQVADADTDAERDIQADSLWNSLGPASTVSARRMAEALYGPAPRCLTYLDTPLRPAVPSLLSQQMTAMEPHDIGDSLIALSGLKSHLDDEEHQRDTVLTQQRSLKDAEDKDAKARLDEEADLAGVRARQQAREALENAGQSWGLYVARRYQEVADQDNALAAEITERAELVAEAEGITSEARRQLRQLRETTDLTAAERSARGEWQKAKELTGSIRLRRAEYTTRQGLLVQERGTLLSKVEGWSGATVGDATRTLGEAQREHAAADAAHRAAAADIPVAEDALARAESGRGGVAGKAIDLLAQLERGITAVGLFDELEIDDEARNEWEPRLWSWRHAIVVDAANAERAEGALADMPGTQIVIADNTCTPTDTPPGIHSRAPIGAFLTTLAARLHYQETPPRVQDESLHLSVIGGFDCAVTGRDAPVRSARADLDAARATLSGAEEAVTIAEAKSRLATLDHDAAVAAARLATIAAEEMDLIAHLKAVDDELIAADRTETDFQGRWEAAQTLAQSHAKDLENADLRLKNAARIEKDRRDRLNEKQRARERLQVPAWHDLYLSTGQDIAAPSSTVSADAERRPQPLYRAASEGLRDALSLYGAEGDLLATAPEALRTAAALRDKFADQDPNALPAVLFEHVAAPLRIMLDGHADNDHVITTRIAEVRAVREQALEALRKEVAKAAERLEVVQDMIESHVEGILKRINGAFDALDRGRGGFGAQVHFNSVRPNGPGPWRWEVTPRWRRSPSGDLVPYREVANGAQVKVFAVQLVLGALLADADTHGRVLVLDELGNSLGAVNRKDVLGALRAVAEKKQVTILGTCQDSVLADAADVCGELLWFTHASATDFYNRPTRIWGYDSTSQRVELTAGWVRAGRGQP